MECLEIEEVVTINSHEETTMSGLLIALTPTAVTATTEEVTLIVIPNSDHQLRSREVTIGTGVTYPHHRIHGFDVMIPQLTMFVKDEMYRQWIRGTDVMSQWQIPVAREERFLHPTTPETPGVKYHLATMYKIDVHPLLLTLEICGGTSPTIDVMCRLTIPKIVGDLL